MLIVYFYSIFIYIFMAKVQCCLSTPKVYLNTSNGYFTLVSCDCNCTVGVKGYLCQPYDGWDWSQHRWWLNDSKQNKKRMGSYRIVYSGSYFLLIDGEGKEIFLIIVSGLKFHPSSMPHIALKYHLIMSDILMSVRLHMWIYLQLWWDVGISWGRHLYHQWTQWVQVKQTFKWKWLSAVILHFITCSSQHWLDHILLGK